MAQLISDDLGMKLEKVEPDMLGRAKKVTISKDDTIILDGGGATAAIEGRCDQIRDAMENSTSDYDRRPPPPSPPLVARVPIESIRLRN